MDDAYDKWFNEERDAKGEWGDVLRAAYDAGLKRGLAADKFDPYEDDYDPKRAELLTLAGKLAATMVRTEGAPSMVGARPFADSVVNTAAEIIAAVNEALTRKEPTT